MFDPLSSRIVACAQRSCNQRWSDMGFCVSSASTVLSVSSSGPCTVTANTSLSLYGRQKQRYQTTCHSLSANSSAACGSGSSANLPSATAAHSWIGSHAKANGATRTVSCSALGGDRDRHGRADPSVSVKFSCFHTRSVPPDRRHH